MIGRKGQGTTEYLIILAVIIVVALVVAGLMGWFPALGGEVSDSQQRAYWRTATPLAVTDWSITSTGSAFSLQNNSADKIQLTDIKMSGTDLDLADRNIEVGDSYTTPSDNTVVCTSGDKYSYDVEITYDVVDGISGQTFKGRNKVVGTCP